MTSSAQFEVDTGIRVVCFDLGGVVVRIHRNWKALFARFAHEDVANRIDQELEARITDLFETYQLGTIGFDQLLSGMGAALGEGIDLDTISRAIDSIVIEEYAGVAGIIEQLGKSGLSTACLSNTNERHWKRMVSWPSLKSMKHHVASHMVGLAKPEHAIYLKLEEVVQARGPEILFFDDTFENVQAARELGWISVHVDPTAPTAPQLITGLAANGIVLQGGAC
ncbi:MAG: hypothetical protein CMJ32_10205 [Phycisphaerae bacterium]|nr:hypothetical protein [Phycisphaerae bacterium]